MHEYERGKKTFAVYHTMGEDPGAHEYHDRAQSLAPWFIESEGNGCHDISLFYHFPIGSARCIHYHVACFWRPVLERMNEPSIGEMC